MKKRGGNQLHFRRMCGIESDEEIEDRKRKRRLAGRSSTAWHGRRRSPSSARWNRDCSKSGLGVSQSLLLHPDGRRREHSISRSVMLIKLQAL